MKNNISTTAEGILDFFANVILVIGLILAFGVFLFGCSQENSMYNPYGMSPMLYGLIVGACIAIYTFLIYAPLKVFINISLRLQEILNTMNKNIEENKKRPD